MTHFIIFILMILANCMIMYGNNNAYRSEEISKRKMLELRKGAAIDTFYFANYATSAVNTHFDTGIQLEECYKGIVALEYKSNPVSWEIFVYDFTDILSSIIAHACEDYLTL